MPVKFPEFDLEDNNNDIAEDLKILEDNEEDKVNNLELIQTEKINPFVNEPKKIMKTYKPPPPSQQKEQDTKIIEEDKKEVKKQTKQKKKRELTEKQRKHLENMRMKKANKKIEQVKETIMETKNDKKFEPPTPEELAEMEKEEFDLWLKNMNKFERIMKKMEIEKKKKEELERKKEEALEAKYRAKFEAEQKAKQQAKQSEEKKSKRSSRPYPRGSVAQPDLPINLLQQSNINNDDPYASYFSF